MPQRRITNFELVGHISKNKQNIKLLKKDIEKIKSDVHFILREVTANGTRGLDASLKDIYSQTREISGKLDEVILLTEGERTWKEFRNISKTVWNRSWIGGVFRTKVGKAVTIFLALFAIDQIVHPFDLHIILFIFKLLTGGLL